MQTNITLLPPATHDLRPERKDRRPGVLDSAVSNAEGMLVRFLRARTDRFKDIVSRVAHFGSSLEKIDDKEVKKLAWELGISLRREGLQCELVARAFALIREAATRTLGMRHFDTQLIGGWVLLKGMVAEMKTGEGKTLTATLAAGTAALAGVPVHVITVNDYLTARDAESMGPIYRYLGLTVGCITHEATPEERRAAYESEITYCTNKEIAFDYLRDRLVLGDRMDSLRLQAQYLYGEGERVRRLVLRGLHYGIVDEADSVLIDEARTPLLISRMTANDEEQRYLEQAMALADEVEQGTHYRIEQDSRNITLTEAGKKRVHELALPLGPLWTGSIRREELVVKALTAKRLFHKDEHYLVQDGKVQIVDEFTGRLMPDRSWERGLHQLIEVKEGCDITEQQETMARISYQRFFRRYLSLAGMTGTAWEVKRELWSVYRLPVVRVPTHRPLIRRRFPDRIFASAEAKWEAVVQQIREQHNKGRPVLVGTRTVAASEHASRLLAEEGLEHSVLNAKQDQEEAEIISQAGQPGVITIATNMAGRGTDIKLGPGVADRDGLYVLLTERHEAKRIDRQLGGRCGRQGDPGTYQAIVSLEDPLMERGAGLLGPIARRLARSHSAIWLWAGKLAVFRAQKKVERLHARIRRDLVKQDERRGDMLSFSGRSE